MVVYGGEWQLKDIPSQKCLKISSFGMIRLDGSEIPRPTTWDV